MRRTTKERKKIQQRLGAHVQQIREQRGMTQRQLAAGTGIMNPGSISKIERGVAAPSLETLDMIARALGLEIKDLFDWGDEKAKRTPQEQRRAVMKVVQLLVGRSDEELRLVANIIRQMFTTYDSLR